MNKLRVFLFIFFSLISLGTFAAPPGYSYYKLCTTQENQITVGVTSLANFPVLVRITDPDLRSTGNGGYVQNVNGYDIIYTAADGNTIIPFQLESYNAVTGSVVAWVKVPVVSSTVNSNFYLYFGNSAIVADQSLPTTWDANYRAVYHLNTNENDGTSNAFNLANSGTTNEPVAVAANGQDMEPTQFLRYSATTGLNILGDVTLETWINFETFRTGQFENVMFSDGVNGETSTTNELYYFNYIGGGVNNNKLQAFWESGAGVDVTVTSSTVANPGIGAWHHVVMVRNTVAKNVTFYFDGVQVGTVVPYATNPSGGGSATLQLGREHLTSANQIDADFDEARISNITRIPEWIQATYQTSMPASTFVQYGPTVCLFMNVSNAGPNQVICSSSPNATMAGNNPIVAGTGTWALVSGSGSITSPTSPTTTITGLGIGANIFSWTLSNGPCTASSSNVTVTVNPAPTTADAGPDQIICANSATLAGNTAAVGVGVWTLVSGSGSITSPGSPTSTVTGLGIGPNVFQWTISNVAPCPASSDQVTITQNAIPTVANAGPDQTICSGNSVFAGNNPVVGTGTWTLISGTGVPTTPSSATSAVTGLSVGANVFQWTVTNGVCPSSSDQLIINVDANPTISNAGPDQSVCATTATLAGNNPSTGTGVWTLISGSGVITLPGSPTSGVSGLGVGPNVFQWTISNGTCTSSTDQVTITQYANPTVANAGPDQTVCATTATFAGNNALVGTGVWTLISGSGVITLPNSPTSGVTGLSVGANVFQWTISNGSCAQTADQITITRNANPTVSNAGPDQTICSGNSVFAGNAPGIGAGTWTLISGTGVPTTPNSATSAVTGLSVGANVFQWTITNGVCPSSSDQVTITRDPNPTVSNAGPDQTVCSTTATLAGNTPGVGSGIWTVISGTGIVTTPSSPASGVTGLSVGANIFQWTISNGTCPSSSDQITITRNANPTVSNAGPDQTICSGNSVFAGNAPGIGVGTWTLISGTGVPTTPSSATSALTGLSVGANVFQWTITNGVCPSSSDQVTITRDPNPTVSNAGPDQTVCSITATLAGNTPGVGSGIWTVISGTGIVTTPSSPASGVTGLSVGANIFQWTISNGTCPSSSDQITITRNANPTVANAGPDQTICSGNSVFAGNAPGIGVGTWTLISGTGVPTTPSSATSALTGLSVGANVFQWTITNGVCPSSSDQVTITRDPNPTVANAGADQSVCISSASATISGNSPAIGTAVWTLVSGTGSIALPNSPGTSVSGLAVGNNIFQWTISNGTCPSSSDQVTIHVDDFPTTADAGLDQVLCTSSSVFTGNTPTVGTGVWTLSSGSGVITSPTSAGSSVTSMNVGTNTFKWTISNGTCPPSADVVDLNVDSIPTTANAGPDQTICSSSATLAGNTALVGNGNWTLISGSGVITLPGSPTSGVTGLGIGANVFQWTISNGICPSTTDQVTINVDANPTVANAGPDQTLCANTTALSANSPLVGTGIWTLVSGTGVVVSPSSPTSTVNGLGIGTNVFQWTISNGTCSPSTDQISITVDPIPSTANAGPDQTICSSVNSLNANNPAIGSGTWTLVSGSGVITLPGSPTSGVTGLGIGANVFQWTISNGICPSNSDQVTINVDANPTIANAGSDQTLCASGATLAGNTAIVGTGTWTLISGSGTITNSLLPNTTVTALGIGPNVFQWTIANGTCSPFSDQVTITRDANPTVANAGPDQTICSSSSAFAGNVPLVGTGTWTLISGGGIALSPASSTSAVNGLNIGANTFQWTIANGSCPSTNDQITITVDANPTTANAGTDQSVCSSSATLGGNSPATGSGIWTLISGSATITNALLYNTTVTSLGIGPNVFQWTISNGTCTASFDQVTIIHDANPTTASAGPDQTFCSSSSVFAGNLPLVGTGIWTLISGTGTPVTPNSETSPVNGLSIGANVFQWTISNGSCPSSSDQVVMNIDQNPTVSNAGADQQICASSTLLAGNVPAVGAGTWTLVSGTGTITNPLLYNTTVTGLGVGVNVFQWTISNGTCTSSSDQVTITRDAVPTSANAGPDQTICASSSVFAGNSPLIGTGLWTLVSGSGVVTTPSSPSSSVTGLGIGANIFKWTISNGSCSISNDQVIINVDQNPTPAFAGTDQTICSTSATMNATTLTVGTGLWSLISGSGTFTNPNSATTNINGLSVGVNSFEWTTINGTCPSTSDTVFITADANPTLADAGPDQTFCLGTSSTFSGNVPLIGTGIWTLVSGNGTPAAPNSATSSVSGLSVGSNIFQWTVSNGVCPSTSDQMVIDVDDLPTVANAGIDQTVCENTGTVNLSGNIPAVGTGTWSLISGSGIISSPLSYNTTVTGMNAGTSSFAWTVSNGICAASVDTVTVFVDSIPSPAYAGIDQNVCGSIGSINLSSTLPITGTGTWSLGSGSGTITLPNSNNTSVSGLAVGVHTFVWSVTNGVCPSSLDTVTILVDSIPTVSNAGADQSTCLSSNTVVLNGNIPTVGTGTWSLISGTGTISSPALNSTSVTGLGPGQNSLAWTISNGTCGLSIDTVVITVDSVYQSIAGSDQNVCGSTATVNLSGNIPSNGTGTWTLASGSGTIVSPNSNSTSVTGLTVGNNSFIWTISSGVCAPSSDTVMVFVDSIPTVSNAGPDQTICASTASVVLNGNLPTVGTGTWTLISGAGTFVNPNLNSTSVTGLAQGINSFAWTIGSGICNPSIDTVIITVDSIPTIANAGPDQSVCGSLSTISLNGNSPFTGTGTWSLISGSGSIANSASASTTVTGLSIGINSFAWTISSGVCNPSIDTLVITVDSIPSVSIAGSDQTICSSIGTILLTANNPNIGTGIWSVTIGGASVATPNSYSTNISNLSIGTNTFAWTISSGACGSSADSVSIFVEQAPSTSLAGNLQNICGDSVNLNAVPPSVGTGIWSMISGAGIIANSNSPSTSVTGLIPGNNVFQYTVSNGIICPSSISSVTIHADAPPDIALAGPDQNVLNPIVTLNGNTPLVGTGTWSVISGNGSFSSTSIPNPDVTQLATGQNEFTWTISNGVCPSTSDSVIVTYGGLVIPNGFSPNGDGINDFWVIPGIQYYPVAKITILNKWGNVVFQSDAYQNDFDGNNQSKQELSDDTYYYSLEISPEESYSGFIVIKREN